MKRLIVAAAMLLVLVVSPGLAATEDEPRFEVFTPEPRLEPGTSQTLTVELVNDAKDPEDSVPPATNVRVTPKAGKTPFEVVSGSRSLGRLADGEIHEVSVHLAVPSDAPGGTYRLPLELSYEYDGDERETKNVRATVEVPHRPIFHVASVESAVFQEETGGARITMRNVGAREARETTLTVVSPNPDVALGGSQSTTVHLGNWPPGTNRSFTVQPRATQTADVRSYPLEIRPSYRDGNGIDRQAPTRFVGVAVSPAQSFSIDNASLDLIGTSATLQARVTNDGPGITADTVTAVESPDPTISVVEATASAGELAPGESARVRYTLRVAPTASAGTHRLTALVHYDRGGPRRYRTEASSFVVRVPEDREPFSVTSVNATLERDASNTLVVRLTNEHDERLRELQARMQVPLPYESERPTAYVEALEPGETETMTFEVTTPGDAVPGSDALSLNVTGLTTDDQRFRAGPYVVPFSIPGEAGPDDSVLMLGVGAAVVLLLVVVGWWWLRR